MESLTETEDAEKMEVKSPPQSSDREAIGKTESLKLQAWTEQIKESTRGFLNPTKSDLLNFLIREHKEELTSRELTQIRSLNYDPVKHINWISQELRTAFVKNDLPMVATLQSELKQIELLPSALVVGGNDRSETSKNSRRLRKLPNSESAIPINSEPDDSDIDTFPIE